MSNIRDNIISFGLGILVWGLGIYAYTMNNNPVWINNSWMPPMWWWRGQMTFDVSEMSEEQLENMATRAGITVSELKEKLESWENMRDIMWESWNNGWNNNINNTENLSEKTWEENTNNTENNNITE